MRIILLVLFAVATVACGPHPLAGGQPTSEALARQVLSAMARRDLARLHALAITEREFEQRVWPGLPAARPERNLPWSYVWMDLRQKSDATLKRTLTELGGREYELREVKFAGVSTLHGNYRVHRDAVLLVRDGADIRELRILGSMIEADGGWKVFSYLTDP